MIVSVTAVLLSLVWNIVKWELRALFGSHALTFWHQVPADRRAALPVFSHLSHFIVTLQPYLPLRHSKFVQNKVSYLITLQCYFICGLKYAAIRKTKKDFLSMLTSLIFQKQKLLIHSNTSQVGFFRKEVVFFSDFIL